MAVGEWMKGGGADIALGTLLFELLAACCHP